MHVNEIYTEAELYPKAIASILSEAGMLLDEEFTMIEDYLWSTQNQEVNHI